MWVDVGAGVEVGRGDGVGDGGGVEVSISNVAGVVGVVGCVAACVGLTAPSEPSHAVIEKTSVANAMIGPVFLVNFLSQGV